MKVNPFSKYKILRENEEKKYQDNSVNPVGTKLSLGEGNQFKPFVISDDPKSGNYGKNKNLAPIVRAFKAGANWGWSRDEDGLDKPVRIGNKKLFLTGGSVRDHLLNKKPRNVELATNASPDEVYHILKQNGFNYLGKDNDYNSKKISPNKKEGSNQIFYVIKTNSKGRPFVFGIKVNEDAYTLEVFMKTPRGVDAELESGTQIEDALGRDFTINGMYIALTNDNGPNKDLHDFFGGMHHLSSKKINCIGDMNKKFTEDPTRILRYVRMLSNYGDLNKVSQEEIETIKKLSDRVSMLDRKVIMDEFSKAINKEDVDYKKYLMSCDKFGILNKIFPGKIVDTKFPPEISEIGDKHAPLAYMLRLNNINSLKDLEIDSKELQKIIFLIKTTEINDDIDAESLYDLTNDYLSSGIPSKKIRDFATKVVKLDTDLIDGFLTYAKSPRIKVTVHKDGIEQVCDDFKDLVDPFTGKIKQNIADQRRKQIELNSFKNNLNFMRKN
jgi:tRNA nucleotidyltransferase/poly(A) polymerase